MQSVVVGSVCFVLAVTVHSIMEMIRTDLEVRGKGAVAIYEARSELASLLMQLSADSTAPPKDGASQSGRDAMMALLAARTKARVTPKGGHEEAVTRVRFEGGELGTNAHSTMKVDDIERMEVIP